MGRGQGADILIGQRRQGRNDNSLGRQPTTPYTTAATITTLKGDTGGRASQRRVGREKKTKCVFPRRTPETLSVICPFSHPHLQR